MYRLMISCYTTILHSISISNPFVRRSSNVHGSRKTDLLKGQCDGDDDSSLFDDEKSRNKFQTDIEEEKLLHTPTILINTVKGSHDPVSSSSEAPCIADNSPAAAETGKFGKLRVDAQYNRPKKALIITVVEGLCLDLVEKNSACQIRIALLPTKQSKHRTKYAVGSNPKFKETFLFPNVTQESLLNSSVRFRIYKRRLTGSNQFLGETTLLNSLLNVRGGALTHHTLTLHPKADSNLNLAPSPMGSRSNSISRRSSMVDDCGRFCAQPIPDKGPELLISLCCDKGQVIVGIERGSAFSQSCKHTDTFIRVSASTQFGKQIGEHRTEVVRSSAEPSYGETFLFPVAKSELDLITIFVRVYGLVGVWRKKVQIGWISMGENSSTPDEQEHWQEMIMGMGTTVSKWHHLITT